MKISKITIKALKIIRDYSENHPDGITPKFFAYEMWPDSPFWKVSYNIGINGATSGKGMWLCAGSYLNKLYYSGLLIYGYPNEYTRHFSLSSKGYKALNEKI